MTETGHSHGIGDATPRNRLVIAFAITSSVFIIEVVGAIITGSLALLVDAAHMLTAVSYTHLTLPTKRIV